ncbi:MAG: AAA family ATPase [Propionibacteriaceae bacterium]|nr:AAA family ATPase [Propionibacteriaceae bacterium]
MQSSLEREIQAEQEYVDLVLTHLQRAVVSAKGLAQESRARFTSDRESWMREEDGTALFERDAFAFLAARRMAALDGEHEGLVFGRLDSSNQERNYIGRLGVRTPDYEPLVIDWRAQAAEPFYRATAVQPMGVVRRRVLSCRDDKVIGIEDDVLMPNEVPDSMTVIGDGALMRALERARGTKMQDIVATIQAEQDEVIRAPYQGFTVITGGPGTGKTVVGLHRVAFLLYTYRRRFTNGGVLVLGPSSIFMDYIERVLPSLGEESVTLRAMGQVASDVLGFSSSVMDREDAWVIKGGLQMVDLLRAAVERPFVEPRDLLVPVKGDPIRVPARDLIRIRHECLSRAPYNEAKSTAEAELVSLLWSLGQHEVDVDELGEFEELVRGSWAFSSFVGQWWPPLAPTQVLAWMADPGLLDRLGGLTADQARVLSASINPEQWSVGDIPLLDELAHILGPIPPEEDDEPIFFSDSMDEIVTIADRLTDHRNLETGTPHNTYAHILVDEAQDITPMQWRMIYRRGANASWTIVGDPAQSSWPDKEEPGRALANLIGTRPQRSFRLSTNYRSPKETYDLATSYIRSIEPDTDIPDAVRSTGVPPRVLVAPDGELGRVLSAEIARLMVDTEGTIGIIALPCHDDDISPVVPCDPRLIRLDPLSSKGLEFDAVVVVDPDSIASSTESGARTLYVALTRPTQELVTIDMGATGAWRAHLV